MIYSGFKLRKKIIIMLIFTFFLFLPSLHAEEYFTIAVVKYKGGDWYSCSEGVENFLKNASVKLNLKIKKKLDIVDLEDSELFSYPIILLNGHGEILLSQKQTDNLKKYLENGGFLIANDDYGMDIHFKKASKEDVS